MKPRLFQPCALLPPLRSPTRSPIRTMATPARLWDLDGFGSSETSEHHAMLIDSGLATGKKAGYVFTLSGCAGSPASSFKVTAVPAEPAIGARSFCSDQSAVIRYAMDGKAATCLTSGKPLN